ncbi:hypothetical protein TRFO_04926 [Tritrichomonas foetus]|uniref:Uncharacterized protein n=1 Tax=Tritrichomonas foetus TaxID=1144522 RepID=A0A1J4KA52_9EUKA|nr:hypothetical protein TRFO_04926 [Tritrichomonas foetus]|eukprot:OHT08311.1 hypothetical protein TRFO_04926 [Tritrichomonas foetus]
MNPLFLPSPQKSKPGLNRVKKMVRYQSKIPDINPCEKTDEMKNNIPDNWFYNKESASKVWDELENVQSNKIEEDTDPEKNPFLKIDQSTTKIRQMCESFEISDQEFLMSLMNILDDDSALDNLDHQNILMEARLQLSSLIENHVGYSNTQSSLLSSLKTWFAGVEQSSKNDFENEIPRLQDAEFYDSTQLAEIINQCFENNENRTDKAALYHQRILDSFTGQIKNLKKEIDTKNIEIEDLKQQLDNYQKSRRRPNGFNKSKQGVKDQAQVLVGAQRKICEQEVEITNLKNALSGRKDDDIGTEGYDKEANLKQIATNQEFEYENRLQLLYDQIALLKNDCASLQNENKKLKIIKIDDDSIINNLNKKNKSLITSMNEFKEKYSNLEQEHNNSMNSITENTISQEYEKKLKEKCAKYEQIIISTKENALHNQQKALDTLEKRHRMQINDLFKNIENSDHSTAIQEVLKQQESKINEITDRFNTQISEMKAIHTDKVKTLTRQYEKKLQNEINIQENLKHSIEADIEASLLKQKMELEHETRKIINEIQSQADNDTILLKKRYIEKIDALENANRKLNNDKNSLLKIINNPDSAKLPNAEKQILIDELMNEEEEENSEECINSETLELKIKEAESRISDKYMIMLDKQKDYFMEANNWELKKLKEEMQRNFDQIMTENRISLIDDLTQIRKKDNINEFTNEIDKLLEEMSNGIVNSSNIIEDVVNRESMIPENEVKEKITELTEESVKLQTENEVLRKSILKLTGMKNLEVKDGNDLISILCQNKMNNKMKTNELLIENEKLREDNQKIINQFQQYKDEFPPQKLDECIKYCHIGINVDELENKTGDIDDNENEIKHNNCEIKNSHFSGEVSMPALPMMNEQLSSVVSPKLLEEKNTTISNEKMNDSSFLKVICQECSHEFSVDSNILQVSTIVNPNVECPKCHNATTINNINDNPFPREIFSEEDIKTIEEMESCINKEVKELISYKKDISNETDETINCNQEGDPQNNFLGTYVLESFITFDMTPSKAILKINSCHSSACVSARDFTSPIGNKTFTNSQIMTIASYEIEINSQINELLEYKMKNSKMRLTISDTINYDIDEVNSYDKDQTCSEPINNSELKLKVHFDECNSLVVNIEPMQKLHSLGFNTSDNNVIFNNQNENNKVDSTNINNNESNSVRKNRVSFQAGFVKPPNKIIQHPRKVELHEDENQGQIILSDSHNKAYSNIGFGTSLDGTNSPFKSSLEYLLNPSDEEIVVKQVEEIKDINYLNNQKNIVFDNNQNLTQGDLKISPVHINMNSSNGKNKIYNQNYNYEQETVFSNCNYLPKLTNSLINHIYIPRISHNSDNHYNPEMNESIIDRSRSHVTQNLQNQEIMAKNNFFLTPEADLIALELSEVGYFSQINSNPNRSKELDKIKSFHRETIVNLDSTIEFIDNKLNKSLNRINNMQINNEFMDDIEKWKEKQQNLQDDANSLRKIIEEISSTTRELHERHIEIVDLLTKALDTAMKLVRGDGEHSEVLIEKMQEQSAYMTAAIREKENMFKQSSEQQIVLAEKSDHILNINNSLRQKDEEIEKLSIAMGDLMNTVIDKESTIQSLKEQKINYEEIQNKMYAQENDLYDKINVINGLNLTLQNDLDCEKMKVTKLLNEKEIAKSMESFLHVPTFVIFSYNNQTIPPSNSTRRVSTPFEISSQPTSSRGTRQKPKYHHHTPLADLPSNNTTKATPNNNTDNQTTNLQKENISIPQSNTQTLNPMNIRKTLNPNRDIMKINMINRNSIPLNSSPNNSNKNSVVLSPNKSGDNPVANELAVNSVPYETNPVNSSGKYKKRIMDLETQILNKTNESIEQRNKILDFQQQLYKATTNFNKLENEYKKLTAIKNSSNMKLESAVQLAASLSSENGRLRKILNNISKTSATVRNELESSNKEAELALNNELRSRQLLHDIQAYGNHKRLKSFAARQAVTVLKWEERRRKILEMERNKSFAVLKAMNLIKPHEEEKRIAQDDISHKKQSHEIGIKITQIKFNNPEYLPHNKESELPLEHSKSIPTYEEAIRASSKHRVPKKLKIGVVANPLKF